MKKGASSQETLEQAIETRIQEMEDPDYVFPKRFHRWDYLSVAGTALVCLLLILLGRYC